MRIDKYLKASHILKRRTISRELAENERVEINGRVVKPAHAVNVGDEVKVTFGNRYLKIRVLSTEEVKKKKDAVTMYEVIDEGFLEPRTE